MPLLTVVLPVSVTALLKLNAVFVELKLPLILNPPLPANVNVFAPALTPAKLILPVPVLISDGPVNVVSPLTLTTPLLVLMFPDTDAGPVTVKDVSGVVEPTAPLNTLLPAVLLKLKPPSTVLP